jgi:antitoxin component of RelBE/YafQ-DinJ toxin-antitoxin module
MPNARRAGIEQLNIKLPAELKRAAAERATQRGESVSDAVRKFLERYTR